jgi:hypothetical protein
MGLFSGETRYTIPDDVRRALEVLHGDRSTIGIRVIYRPWYVRLHMAVKGGRFGSTTRPETIFTNLPEDTFFRADAHVIHEFYHVIEQWRRQNMTRIGYLLTCRRREREAEEFAENKVETYRQALRGARIRPASSDRRQDQ